MSHSLVTPPPANSVRGWLGRVWEDPESRSTLVGIVGVIVFYLLLWLAAPYLLRFDSVVVTPRPNAASKQFNIEMAPDTFDQKVVPKPPPPQKFVEANPDAPENTPDKTNNFAARNQQVAQEKPTPDGASDRPATEGKKDVDTTQIVSGQLSKPIEHQEAVPEVNTPPQEAKVALPRAEQNPLPGFEKKEGDDKQSFGSNIAKIPDNARPIPQKIEGSKVPLVEGATETMPAIDPQKPRPRQMIVSAPKVRPAILADNPVGTRNVGPVSYDARWSNYGRYLQLLIDSVQIQWERILSESKIYPPTGTSVTVKFIIDSEGKIARIVNVDNQSTEQAARACVSAITDRAPYGKWTDDMIDMLGKQQEMTFKFFYTNQ
jgi:hypothetical protein